MNHARVIRNTIYQHFKRLGYDAFETFNHGGIGAEFDFTSAVTIYDYLGFAVTIAVTESSLILVDRSTRIRMELADPTLFDQLERHISDTCSKNPS